ncbi:hypothetical protein LTR95_005907 [Oleoguttula sp. CCFEE 5521]
MAYPMDRQPGKLPSRDPVAQHANGVPRDRSDDKAAPPDFLNPRQGAARSNALQKNRSRSEEHMHPSQRHLIEAHRRISSAPDPRAFEAPKTYSDIQDQHGQLDRRPPPPRDAGLGKGGWKRPVTDFPQPLNAIAQRPRFSTSEWVDAPQLRRQRRVVDPGSELKRDRVPPPPPRAAAVPALLVSSAASSIASTSRRKRALNILTNFSRKVFGQEKETLEVAISTKANMFSRPEIPSNQPSSQPVFAPRPSRVAPLHVAWNSRPAEVRARAPARSPGLGGTEGQAYDGKGKRPAYPHNAQSLPSRQRYRLQHPPSPRQPFHRKTASQPPSVNTILEIGESDAEHDREDSTNASEKSGDDDVPLAILQCNALAQRLRLQRGIPESVRIPPRQHSTSTADRTFVSLEPAAGVQLTRQPAERFTIDSEPDSIGGRENVQGVQRSNSRFTVDSETGFVASQHLTQGALRIANPDPHDLNSCICLECRKLRMLRRYQTCNISERTEELHRQMKQLRRVPLILETEAKFAKLVAQYYSSPEDSEVVVEDTFKVLEPEEAGPDVQYNANAAVNEYPAEESTRPLINVESKAGLCMPPPKDDKNGNEDSVPGAWIEPKYFGDEDF